MKRSEYGCIDRRRFIDNSFDPEYFCSSCSRIIGNACILPCQHTFGKECIASFANRKECPICRNPFMLDDVDYAPELEAKVASLIMRCSRPECSHVCQRRFLEDHEERQCKYRLSKCDHCQRTVPLRELADHDFQTTCLCGETFFKCVQSYHSHFECPLCQSVMPNSSKLQHSQYLCPNRKENCSHCQALLPIIMLKFHNELISCPSCGELIYNCVAHTHGISICKNECSTKLFCSKSLSSHELECPLQLLPCPLEKIGCKILYPRNNKRSHPISSSEHLLLLVKKIELLEMDLRSMNEKDDELLNRHAALATLLQNNHWEQASH